MVPFVSQLFWYPRQHKVKMIWNAVKELLGQLLWDHAGHGGTHTGGLTWVSDRLHSQCLCWHFLSSAGGGCALTHSPHIEKGGETWGLMQASVTLGPVAWDKIFDFLALSFGAGQGCEADPCPCRGGRAGPAWAVQVRAPFAVRFQARGRRAI